MTMPDELWSKDGCTKYRKVNPDELVITREELEGMRHKGHTVKGIGYVSLTEQQTGHNALIDTLIERIGK